MAVDADPLDLAVRRCVRACVNGRFGEEEHALLTTCVTEIGRLADRAVGPAEYRRGAVLREVTELVGEVLVQDGSGGQGAQGSSVRGAGRTASGRRSTTAPSTTTPSTVEPPTGPVTTSPSITTPPAVGGRP